MNTSLRELAWVFFKLGATAFGGPAAHIAMMRTELIERRRWLSEAEFIDLIGITSLIPGPNSTEMVFHIGLRQAGLRGLAVAGVCFIGPAMLIVLVLAWIYVHYGALPQTQIILDSLNPVILAIIAYAVWMLGRSALKTVFLVVVAALVALGVGLGFHELVVLGAATLFAYFGQRLSTTLVSFSFATLVPVMISTIQQWSISKVVGVFLKIGAVLYGSGYVLIAYLRSDFVERLGWLTDQQLLDAVAVGQITPGPLFTTATFIGYVIGARYDVGVLTAVLSTVAIFAPGALFVVASQPLLRRLQASESARLVLNGLNAASLGLMAAVVLQLIGSVLLTSGLPSWAMLAMAALSFMALARWKINPTWLLLMALVVGAVRLVA